MDTRDKRSSAIHVSLPWRGFFPAPDGALNQGDWQHICLMYRGIEAASGAFPVDDDNLFTPGAQHLYFTPKAKNLYFEPENQGNYYRAID